MPKHKKPFIDRKTATSFLLVERSHQDKYLGDTEAPQHALKEVSRKKQLAKYGVYFDDDYDYMQHLRVPFSAVNNENDKEEEEIEEEEEEEEEKEIEEEEEEEEEDQEEEEEGEAVGAAQGLVFHEELFGWEDAVFHGRDLAPDEVDEDLRAAMARAEAGEQSEEEGEDEDGEFPDDFVALASAADPEGDELPTRHALVDHFFRSLGEDAGRLADCFDEDEDEEEDEEEDVLRQLREHRQRLEATGEDFHSQCLSLQIEKMVEESLAFDVEEIRSRLSGVSCALTESMRQAVETDMRMAERSLVRDPDALMTAEEKAENVARTLAMIEEKEESAEEEEEEEDPVQAWVEFDQRPRITETIDSERVGHQSLDTVLASCTVHPASVALRSNTRRRKDDDAEPEPEQEAEPEREAAPTVRAKDESAEERRQRKAEVKRQQRERRAAKKENKLSFKSETARQKSVAVKNPVVSL